MAVTPHGTIPDWMVGPLATATSLVLLMGVLSWIMVYVVAHMKHEHVLGWFQHLQTTMASLTQVESDNLIQVDDLELGLPNSAVAKRRRKKPSSVLRQIANRKRNMSKLITFFIAEDDCEDDGVETGSFDLEDSAWLKVLPRESLSLATQHFIGDDDSSHSSPHSHLCSGDA